MKKKKLILVFVMVSLTICSLVSVKVVSKMSSDSSFEMMVEVLAEDEHTYHAAKNYDYGDRVCCKTALFRTCTVGVFCN